MLTDKLYPTALLLCLAGTLFFSPAMTAATAAVSEQQVQKTVSGKVIDASTGEAIIGASVVQKGTNNGAITDLDGNYTFSAPAGATVQVSSIGYQTYEFVLGNAEVVNVELNVDALGLEETIVIGYGTARKKDVTGSVVRADINAFRESPNVNVAQSLQGAVAGLNVGAATTAGDDPEMTIRGTTSISGATSPLLVLDGVIYRGQLSDINPADIESIDVLKDASATAIYGSQAAAGVLMITTKNVKSLSKPIIAYDGSYTFQTPTKKMLPYDREGFLNLIADYKIAESRTGDDLLGRNTGFDPVKYFSQNPAAQLWGYENGVDTDWYSIYTNDNPHIQSHNVSLRGRSELSSYFISVGYTDQENYMLNDNMKRYNIRANFDARVTDWMKVGVQAFYTVTDMSGVSPTRTDIIKSTPIISPYLEEKGQPDVLRDVIYNTNVNPLLRVDLPNTDVRNNLNANFFVDINVPFIKGLNYRLNASQSYICSRYFYFSDYDAAGGFGQKDYENEWVRAFDNILTYKKDFGKNDINVTLVYGCEKITDESTSTKGQEFANSILGFNFLGAANASKNVIASDAWQETSLYSMARLAYNYDSRYYLTATVRRDGFSGFGANNKIGVFPSVALSWNITNEKFMENTRSWLDNLKFRVSYGMNGNRSLSRYQTLAQIATADQYLYGDGGQAQKGAYVSALANADLKWETTKTFNVGLDFSLLNNRLFGSVEGYKSKTENLLYNVNIPTINYGLKEMATNIGQLSNHGIEITLTGIPVKTRDFTWTITGNFSRNRNKVDTILGIDGDGDGLEDDLVSSKIFIGKPYGVNYDYNITGMYQVADYKADNSHMYGTYVIEDLNGDTKLDAEHDRKILSYTDPSYRISIQNIFNWKNWEFKFFINSIQGGKMFYRAQSANNNIVTGTSAEYNIWKDYDYWTPENPNARYRQLGSVGNDPAQGKSVPYLNRSFVRLQDVTLSYTVPQSLLKKVKVNNLKVFVSGKNLLTFTGWDGLDPETGAGFMESANPVMKSVSGGVNFEF